MVPLRCVNRFKQLARVKGNAALIQRDLDRYHEGSQRDSKTPCPYISFLAGSAFTTDIGCEVGDTYFSRIYNESTKMGSMGGDNNDGITVIDIFTPQNPSYCFVSFRGREWGYYRKVSDPLADDEVQEAEAHNVKAIKDLDDMPVLTFDVLAATWPHEYKPRAGSRAMSVSSMDTDSDVEMGSSGAASPMTGQAAHLKPTRDSVVNLSQRDLSSTDLLAILKDLPPFTRLDVSHNKAVDKATLFQIMKEHRLEWLNIDGCNVSNVDLVDLLSRDASLFRGVEVIIHPAFLSLENLHGTDTTGIPNAFRVYYGGQQAWVGSSGWVSLPFFGIDQLVQNLTDFIEIHEQPMVLVQPPEHSNLGSILGSCYREEGQSWATRDVQVIPANTGCGTLEDGYSFMFFAEQDRGQFSVYTPLKGFDYGIVLPDGKNEFVDISRFLEHLEQEGWPKPKNGEAVKRLVGKFNKETGPGFLKDLGAIMRDIRSRFARTMILQAAMKRT